MIICPSCKYLGPDAAEVCAVCGERLGDAQRLPSAPTTVVNRSPRPSDAEPVLTVRTPPPASLPAPMIEPIVPVPAEPPGSLSGTALTRGLADYPSDTGSGAAAAAVTVRGPSAVGLAPPTVLGQGTAGSGTVRAPAAEPRLVVVRGERLNVAYPILDGKNYVGRCADRPVDIDLDGQEPVERIWTSRQHAVLTWDRRTLVVEDLNSLNGTFVNRTRIHPGHRHVLQPGDVVQIGTVQMRVVV